MKEAGETGFHAWLAKTLPAGKAGILPIGDDCAAIPAGGHTVHLLTTDSVLEGTHFPPTAHPRLVGRFAANVNLSDLAAKGGRPLAFLGAMLLPPDTLLRWSQEAVLGMEEACQIAGCHLLGGDSKRSEHRGIAGVAVGEADDRQLMALGSAEVGDLIATTGSTGRGSAAYVAWRDEALAEKDALNILLNFRPRLTEGMALARVSHATTDSSDGLLAAVRHICEASHVSARLRDDWIPYDSFAQKVVKVLELEMDDVAFVGGDYELITTFPRDALDGLLKRVARAGGRLTVIGEVVPEKEPSVLERDGEDLPLPTGGWDSFRSGYESKASNR
jgi:thiamine-monophosphate kinase